MLQLNEQQLNQLFPFCLKMDVEKNILFLGSSLQKLLGEKGFKPDEINVSLNGVEIELRKAELRDSTNISFALDVEGDLIDFKGLIIENTDSSEFVFLVGPVTTDPEKLKMFDEKGVSFAPIDHSPQLLEEIDRNHFVRKEMTEVADRLMVYHDELIDTTARLNSLLDSLDSAILSESQDRKIVMVNELFCKLFNMPGKPEDYVGMDCSHAAEFSKNMFTDPEDFVAGIVSLVTRKERAFGELLYLKDGRVLERDFIPVFEHGIYSGHTWKYQDITEVLHNKESLVKTEDKYSRIIENLKFGLVEVDLNEVITKVYPAFCELTGYSEEELIGQNARDLFALKEDLSISEKLNDKRKEGVSNVYERRIRRKDGKVIYLIISGAPIFNDQNEIIGSMGIHVDITDRKLLEQDLTSAKEAALASMKAKEMFLANMSHEIRTPMNVIIGMTDLISESELNADQRKYINAVKTSADNLLGLINDILDFSKIEAGHLQLEEQTADLHDVFNQLELGFTELATKKGISFNCKVEKSVSHSLVFDAPKLNQVLVNLISNAIKFTEKGQVRISAELLVDQKNTQKICFSVKDTGIGIDRSNHEQIFSIFIQEDAGVSRKFGGTGLGLSISRSIVRKMGGDITLNSKKGEGSEFTFELVFARAEKEELPAEELNGLMKLGNIRILVAEDNELNRLLISSVLNKEKVFHRIAENGREAIEFLQKDAYDIILMDIQMPEMDGITATRKIREELQMSIPIVALSANATADDTRNYLAVGMNAHVPKPFKKEMLFDVVKSMLKQEDPSHVAHEEVLEINGSYSTSELDAIGGGDDQFVLSVLQTFVTTIPKQLDNLEIAVKSREAQAVRSIAHQLKPSIDLLHIDSVKDLVRAIERESAESLPDFSKMQLSVESFNKRLTAVVNEIQQRLDQ
jgi:PAS domain S-box-containing protein